MDDYPEDGNIKAVLDWVGDDVDRAAHAQAIELAADGGGRKTLTNALEAIVADGADDDEVESEPQPEVKRTRISRVGNPPMEIRHG